MAIREYIGARYVPKFMGTYNPSQSYEVLDVVDNGQGTSYILKKPAPAGTPVTNTVYWALYGATSGAIINLQNQINTLRADVAKIPRRRKFVLLGDSYSIGIRGGGQSRVDGWGDFFYGHYPNDTYWYDPEVDGTPAAINGAPGFFGTCPFISLLDWIYDNKLGTTLPEEITDVVVIGGQNEPNTISRNDLANYIKNTFVPHVKQKFPNAEIAIGAFSYYARKLVNESAYFGYREGARRAGVTYLDDILNLASNDDWYSGYFHINETGYAYCNPLIAEAILNHHCEWSWLELIPLSKTAQYVDIQGNYDYNLCKIVSNKGVQLRVVAPNNRGWHFKNNKSWNYGTLDCAAFNFTKGLNTSFVTNQAIHDGHFRYNGNYDGDVSVMINIVNDTGIVDFVGWPDGQNETYSDIEIYWNGAKYHDVIPYGFL